MSAVIIKANTNWATRQLNGIDASETTGDTVAMTYPNGVGLASAVKFHWNGGSVEVIGNTRS